MKVTPNIRTFSDLHIERYSKYFYNVSTYYNVIRIQEVNRRLESEYGVSHLVPEICYLPSFVALALRIGWLLKLDIVVIYEGSIIFIFAYSIDVNGET